LQLFKLHAIPYGLYLKAIKLHAIPYGLYLKAITKEIAMHVCMCLSC